MIDYYPQPAEEKEDKAFEITLSQSLSKTVTVTTTDYETYYSEEDGCTHTDTYGTSWKDVFAENEHRTPMQLIDLFKSYLTDELERAYIFPRNERYLKELIEECNNWVIDETDAFG